MARVPIGGTDFSTRKYAYNELPIGDANLTNFNLSQEDYNYKVNDNAMLRAVQLPNSERILIISPLLTVFNYI